MENTNPVQISEDCWIHNEDGDIGYRRTSDPESDIHREDGPAVECSNGDKEYYIDGEIHRIDGPAIERTDISIKRAKHLVSKEWWYKSYRVYVDSQEEFDKWLRENHPEEFYPELDSSNIFHYFTMEVAYQISENCWQHINECKNVFYRKSADPKSELHREDGPAVEYVNGIKEWWLHNKRIDVNSQEEF